MSRCKHTSWLNFYKQEQVSLCHTSALRDVIAALDAPERKYPSLVVLLGDLRSYNVVPRARYLPRTQVKAGMHLQLDPNTAFSDFPTLLAYGNAEAYDSQKPELRRASCHTHSIRELPWPDGSREIASCHLYSQLLQPFAHLICIFIANGESPRRTADRLRAWCIESRSLKTSQSSRPRLLIVTAAGEVRTESEIRQALLEVKRADLSSGCEDPLPHITIYDQYNPECLQDRIRHETIDSREERLCKYTLFSAVHLDHLFRTACDHLVTLKGEPIDLLEVSRLHRPVAPSLGEQVTNLLANITSYEELSLFAAPYIAQCLGLDNYTKDVHGSC